MALCKKKTEKLWLWRAYDPIARRTIAWVLGRRDDATCQKLLNKIGLEGKTFVTDDWEGYHRLIPDDQLFTGKDLTVPIEQDNSNIRHFLARFRRRTKVVSKVVEMVDLSLRIYHHFHDNLDAFAEKAAVFRAIFSLTKSHLLRLGQNRRLSGSLRRHAPLLLTRIAGVDSLVSQLIRDLEGELKLAVRQVTVFLDDG